MDFTTKINSYAKKREPFFFAIDFEQQEYILEDSKVLFQIKNFKNFTPKKPLHVESLIHTLCLLFHFYFWCLFIQI